MVESSAGKELTCDHDRALFIFYCKYLGGSANLVWPFSKFGSDCRVTQAKIWKNGSLIRIFFRRLENKLIADLKPRLIEYFVNAGTLTAASGLFWRCDICNIRGTDSTPKSRCRSFGGVKYVPVR